VLDVVQPILDDPHVDANRTVRRPLAAIETQAASASRREAHLLLVLDDLQRVELDHISGLLSALLEHGPALSPDPARAGSS
jgi:hypothetical protein